MVDVYDLFGFGDPPPAEKKRVEGPGPYKDGLPPSARDCDTSQAAAAQVAEVAGDLRRKVYDFIVTKGDEGATDHEIHIACDMRRYTAAPRRRELVLQGFVRDSGQRRKTDTGSSAKVWVAVPEEQREDAKSEAEAEDLRRSLKGKVSSLPAHRCRQLLAIVANWDDDHLAD